MKKKLQYDLTSVLGKMSFRDDFDIEDARLAELDHINCCTTNLRDFGVLHAPTSSEFGDRMRDVMSGLMKLDEAQRKNAENGYEIGEIARIEIGFVLVNHHSSLGGPAWFSDVRPTLDAALKSAREWWQDASHRREVIIRRSLLYSGA